MPRLSQRAAKNRLAIISGIAAALAVAWVVFGEHGVSLIDTTSVDAVVVDVISSGQSRDAAKRRALGIVTVELPAGGRARVFVPAARASVGTTIRLKVKRYSDGSQEAFAIAENGDNAGP